MLLLLLFLLLLLLFSPLFNHNSTKEYQLLVFSEGDAVFVHQDLVPDLEMMATGVLDGKMIVTPQRGPKNQLEMVLQL